MSRVRERKITGRPIVVVSLLVWFCGVASLVFAQFQKTYDWTVELETQAVNDKFDFPGTSFKEMARVKASFYKGTDRGAATPVHYEDLWYAGHQIVGIRRDHQLNLAPGEQLVIKVMPSTGEQSQSECQAAADAIVRIVIDAYAVKTMTSAVVVPASSLGPISQAMGRLNFVPAPPARPDEPVYSIMILHLYSDPAGQEITMNYNMGT